MSFSGVNKEDLAYLAGIVDGEGCISVGTKERGANYHCRVSVGMVELSAVTMLHETFGGSLFIEKRANLRPLYRWYLSKGKDIYNALEALRPYLRIKGRQADLVMEFVRENPTPNGGKQTEQELARRASLYAQAKKLNTVGKAALFISN